MSARAGLVWLWAHCREGRQRPAHRHINKKNLDIRGVWGIDYSHMHRALLIQARYDDRFHWDRFITHRFGLDSANEALEAVRSGKAIKALIEPRTAGP